MTGTGKTTKQDIFKDTSFTENEEPKYLLNLLIGRLSPNQQIAILTDALVMRWGYGEKAIVYLAALKRAFGEDEIAFRQKLMQIYFSISVDEYGDFSTNKLHYAILKEILSGWTKLGGDAKTCFEFICKAYKPEKLLPWRFKELRQKIVALLRESLKDSSMEDEDLNRWICREETPGAIATVLYHAKVSGWNEDYTREPVPPAVVEFRFIAPFDLHNRAIDATVLVRKYMEKVRIADELATKLMDFVRPMIKSGDVLCHLESAEIIRFRVKLIYKKGADDNPDDIFMKVQAARDGLLKRLKYPPEIFITIENPDGGIIKEE